MSAQTETLCAIPIQIPVHRIRVTVQCLATGGPVHTAALRLADYWGESPEEIAEVLGLQIPRTAQLLNDLKRGGEPIERDFVLWVDHARERVLPYSALDDAAAKPSRYGPFTLTEDPPTPQRLKHMGLDAGLSWDLGLAGPGEVEGHVEVLEVIDVTADIRDRALPHVLRLPDTQLVIATPKTGTAPDPTTTTPAYEFSIAQHGTIDPQLTGWARTHHTDTVTDLIQSSNLATDSTPAGENPTGPTVGGQDHWDAHDPHPARLREQIAEAANAAEERLVLSAPDLRHLPAWLEEALKDTQERDVQIVLCPTQPDHTPAHPTFAHTTNPRPRQPQALTVLADDTRAVMHSDPPAVLDRRAMPARQRLYTTTHERRIATLLDTFGLKRLRPPTPRHRPTKQTIARMLKESLDDLRQELPKTLTAHLQPEDERFAHDTIDRQRTPENPTAKARRTAAGIAWERTLTTLVRAITDQQGDLQILAERWKPSGAKIDLDLILADDKKHVTWIIDAKNANPTNDQLHKMQTQIRLLQKAPELAHGRPAIAVIVHRKHQLDTPLQPTEHHNILRCTLQHLPNLLQAKHLPGERARARTERS